MKADDYYPVCGYYCTGNGGVFCIDKKSVVEQLQKFQDEKRERKPMSSKPTCPDCMPAFTEEEMSGSHRLAYDGFVELCPTHANAVTLLESEREHADKLTEAAFPMWRDFCKHHCRQHDAAGHVSGCVDYAKLLAAHGTLRGRKP